MHVKSHNMLSTGNIYRLFSLPQISDDNTVSILTQLMFIISLQTALRPSKLPLLRLSQVSGGNYNGVSCIRFKGRLGTVDGTSKTAQGGWKDSSAKPKEISVFDETVTVKSTDVSIQILSVSCFATVKKILASSW